MQKINIYPPDPQNPRPHNPNKKRALRTKAKRPIWV
jgi:hypothetical protein